MSTLAILAGGPDEGSYTGKQALSDFQQGISDFVAHYGDGRSGPSGQGKRARGFDLDSKVQVFETVIRGVGGLLSAHLFAVGDLPIPGYDATPLPEYRYDDPLELAPIPWPGGFRYDGQLLRLALDLAERLLPAFYTPTGIPYPRVNLRSGIPFYVNSPLHSSSKTAPARPSGQPEITETCSAGAGSLTLEFTVLSRLTGDPRFEQAAKRAFWEVWDRRSDIGLIGNGIDAERGSWIGPHAGIGAGMDSFFEYALKSHILLSGHGMPNTSASTAQSRTGWLDPNTLHPPLSAELHSSDAFLQAWHQAHASVKRYLYTDRNLFPYYSNNHRATGQPYTMWIDSLGAFYPGLLALAGEVDEAVEANLVYTALWTRYAAIPERWSIRENNVEQGLGWWPGRPEFIESTYHIFRATKDPWYLRVGEMVLQDIQRRCYEPCGWAGLQDVRTGEKQDRMESFFLGETTKYMYLLFDPDHKLNNLDAAYVFTTEGHPLIIPKKSYSRPSRPPKKSASTNTSMSLYTYYDQNFTNSCPAPKQPSHPLAGSVTASRLDLFDVSRFTKLYDTPNIHGPIEKLLQDDKGKDGPVFKYRATSNHTIFPWTLPPTMLPSDGICIAPKERIMSWVEFPTGDGASSFISQLTSPLTWLDDAGPTIQNLEGVKLQLEREYNEMMDENVWRITGIGNTALGRHDIVNFYSEHVRHFKDDAFTCLRRTDIVDIVMLVEEPEPEPHEATQPDPDATDEPAAPTEESNAKYDSVPLLKNLLRAMTSVFDPTATDAPAFDDLVDDQPNIITWTANLPTGPGAFPLPSTADTLVNNHPGFDARNPEEHFPWKSIYFAEYACDAPLEPRASRKHQVILMRRGGCSFNKKLDNIPSFAPGPQALQLVLILDERDPTNTETLPRPLLDAEQFTPSGVKRHHGIPMVLMQGEIGDYDLFRASAGVGMRRRYKIRSQGLMVDNAMVI